MKKLIKSILLLIFILLISVSIVFAKAPRKLESQLMEIQKQFKGDMGISFHHLKTGDKIEINSDEKFPTASTIKTAVMCEAFRQLSEGKHDYFDTMMYSTTRRVGGSGFIQNYKDGTNIELKELVHFMIHASDNTGTNLTVDFLGGFENINRWLINHGFKDTRILTYIGGGEKWDYDLWKEYGLGVTTPREMRRLMEMIVLNQAGSRSACEEMQRILARQYFDGVIQSQIPPYIGTGAKGGSINVSRSDIAIVNAPTGTYILSVYTQNNKDTSWTNNNEAWIAIKKISSLIWKHYNPRDSWIPPSEAESY